ncbi:MAG: ATPase domain-containing protein, partial [Geminicoccales bacterium]
MPKPDKRYVCQSCGAVHAKWAGRCDACGDWNTLAEEAARKAAPKGLSEAAGRRFELVGLDDAPVGTQRLVTGIEELDRVLGGGLVEAAAILIGGDPGIGKSTLVLQAAAALASAGVPVAYVSGEESVDQIRLRAARLGLARAPLRLAAATAVADILATLDRPG